MSTAESKWGTSENAEATEAWDGPLFDRFVAFRDIVTDGLGAHGEAALALVAPRPGQRVLDVGCGFGDASQRIAGLVGPEGDVLGVDVAPRFIQAAEEDASEAGVTNVRFRVADVQTTSFVDDGPFDLAFSRFGTMFFGSPVPALRNVRDALAPDGRLVMVVWRRKLDNDWMYRAEVAVKALVERPEETDEPTCGPGPFSMADADTTSGILDAAGFTDIGFRRSDIPITIGHDLDEAMTMVKALGPAGEVLRLAGDDATHLHDQVDEALRSTLSEFAQPDGTIRAPASTWVVTATPA